MDESRSQVICIINSDMTHDRVLLFERHAWIVSAVITLATTINACHSPGGSSGCICPQMSATPTNFL